VELSAQGRAYSSAHTLEETTRRQIELYRSLARGAADQPAARTNA
jgi:hypothetical protein